MCGINGFSFKNSDLIVKMNQVTKHRGPDDSGIFVDELISLGHNRLSIIDLSADAAQPMTDDGGRFVIVFNGEIYNYLELKNELLDFYNFKTSSDTEVILVAYGKWGEECLQRFNGIFAFAIWDKLKKTLFLARDNSGVKPLYYYLDDNKIIFSSEIKAILEHNVERVLDKEAFNYYFSTLFVPEPLTMFRGIRKFPAASCAYYKNGELKIKKYWELKDEKELDIKKNVLADDLRERVKQSVKNQLISDRPLGIYLSGGVDSSCILDCVSEYRDNISTFSVGFDLKEGEEWEKFNKDFLIARETAKKYKTNHNEVMVGIDDVIDFFEKAIWHLDEPVSNPTIIPMLKLAKFVKEKGVDVVLCGDGSDELFGGYERYRFSLIASYYQKIPAVVRNFLERIEKFKKLNIPSNEKRHALFLFQKNKILSRVISNSYLNNYSLEEFYKNKYYFRKDRLSFEKIFMNVDRQTWLRDESLLRGDKMSMAYGLEARVPFLEKELIEFANLIPIKYKINLFDKKIILKEAFKKRLPDYIFKQPKRGWFSPAAKWLRYHDFNIMAKNILSKDYYQESADLFLWENINTILDSHGSKKEYNLTIIWSLMTFQVWMKKFNVKKS